MTDHTFDAELLSDLHKDTYGSRPGEGFWSRWEEASDDERQKIWDNLLLSLEDSINQDTVFEASNCRDFEEEVARFMVLGNVSWSTAVRWIMEASEWNGYGFADFLGLEFGIRCDKAIAQYQEQWIERG